jgi:RNA polymerase sigma factor (sigma-70 family)
VTVPRQVEQLLRELAPRVLGVLVRRTGDFETCEDAVQEALLAAATQWPAEGVPANPTGWLVTVASRRRTELWRNETARRRRERVVFESAVEPEPVTGVDDTLTLLTLCCHPALTPVSQVALTLRAVGGLTTAEIARALLVPEPTVAQRISRAKQRIRAAGGTFAPPADDERADRLAAVLHVLYLIFTEGHTASSGSSLQRVELSAEALLALMLLTDARRPARTTPDGNLVPLAAQDRSRWDQAMIAEGTALLEATLPVAPLGPYQLQAAIAAVHDTAPTAAETDWPQILGLYELLAVLAPGPMVELNRLVAVAMVHGPEAGLAALATAAEDPALAGHHRLAAVRAHLLELAGDAPAARTAYLEAARLTLSAPERRYLESRAAATR